MSDTLDIQKVISTSTSSVSLEDLNKKGFKQVKVLNQAIITKLIGEAVDRVLSARSKDISREERDKVIKEAKTQFETLARKRLEKERGRIDELERSQSSLTSELETLRMRLAASVEVQAERDQAVARAEKLERELGLRNAEAGATQAQIAQLAEAEARGEQARSEAESLRARLAAFEVERKKGIEENHTLRDALAAEGKRSAQLEGQLQARSDELERVRSEGAENNNVEKLLAAVAEKLGKSSTGDMSQVMLSLDTMSRRLSNISSGGGGGGGGEVDAEITKDFALNALFDKEKAGGIESNVSNVKLRENKAAGVKGALAKLKKLQQGVADGE